VTTTLPGLVEAFAGLHVVVVGEAMLDTYLEGSSGRLCREAPVPIVQLESRTDLPGGAANTAVNVAALGGRVALVSVVGDDTEGGILRRALLECGVGCDRLVVDGTRRTLVLHRVVASSQLLVRFDQGSTDRVAGGVERMLIENLSEAFGQADAVIVSDYGKGLLTPAVVEALRRLQVDAPRVLIVDSKHPAAFRRLQPTAVKPNWSEALQLLGTGQLDGTSERADGIATEGDRILELTGAQIAAVTLDSEGAIVFERGRPPHRTYAPPGNDGRATGAGDTFVSALTLALAAGAHTPAAAELASAAASVVVGRPRTSVCSAEELRAHVSPEDKYLASIGRLRGCVELHRSQGRRVIFTNGCFDILHRGHITYLNRAKTLGDVLIVGVNDDASVRRLKGPARPINPLEDRAAVLSALSCVDHIIAFSGDSPTDVIRAIRPDIYVKGGDYTHGTLPEAPLVEELGGVVRILPYMEDRSTTGTIERIRGRSRADRARR
jgi:D-beta-D-heptose 7-phosphate kinase/D-beta-D-heptose 1-phosphate adenosyltransferase